MAERRVLKPVFRTAGAIFGRADLRSQSECDDVSTFRKAQKYSRETPKQSSTLPPPNSAIRVTSLMRAGQTFQQATQVQTLRLCPSQGWPRHRPDKLANTQQNPAFAKLSMDRCTQAWTDGARWNNDVLHCSAECLLLAQSGHPKSVSRCPILG